MRKNKILSEVIAKAIFREKSLGYLDILEIIEEILNNNGNNNK
jgi:hypothetical protein